jgi:hypothetical protein
MFHIDGLLFCQPSSLYVQSTAHQTWPDCTLWTLYHSYFKGISANTELQVCSLMVVYRTCTACGPGNITQQVRRFPTVWFIVLCYRYKAVSSAYYQNLQVWSLWPQLRKIRQSRHYHIPKDFKRFPLNKFKKIIRDWLVQNAFYSVEEFLNRSKLTIVQTRENLVDARNHLELHYCPWVEIQ